MDYSQISFFVFGCYVFKLGIAIVSVAEEGRSRVLARCGGPSGRRCSVLGSEELVGRLLTSSSAGTLFAGPSGHRWRGL